jgi:hypothetical protein
VKLYRAALHLYPSSFRREFGDDMVLLVEHQLHDEGTARVAARTLVDLFITVPTRHLEAHMSRSSQTTLTIVFAALGVLLAVVGGPVGLLAGLGAFALAAVTYRRSQPIVARNGQWWKLLLGGVVLLGSIAGITTATGELDDGWWYVAMLGLLTSFLLIAAGVVVGIASRFRTA